MFAITRASVVFPLPGRPVEDRGADAVLGDREPQRRLLAEDLLLPDEVVEPLRAHPKRERRGPRQPFVRRVREEIAHGTEVCCSGSGLGGHRGVRRAEGEAERDVGCRALPERDRHAHRSPRDGPRPARARGWRDLARPRVRHRCDGREGGQAPRRRDRDRSRARADRDREGAGPGSRGSTSTTASATARTSMFRTRPSTCSHRRAASCSRRTTRRRPRSWRGSSSPVVGSASRTGPPRAVSRRCSG